MVPLATGRSPDPPVPMTGFSNGRRLRGIAAYNHEGSGLRSIDGSACEASNPFAGWSLHSISIAVWIYGRTRPATPKPRR